MNKTIYKLSPSYKKHVQMVQARIIGSLALIIAICIGIVICALFN